MTTASRTKRLGARAYARWRKEHGLPGATHQAVTKAIEAGRIAESVVFTPKGWPKIDPEAADKEWAENTSQEQSRDVHRGPAGDRVQGDLFDGPAPDTLEAAEAESAEKPKGAGYTRYRAEREQWLARMAKLEFLERDGSLCDVESARREEGRLWGAVRDALLNIPDRVSGPLEGSSAHEIRVRLQDEIRTCLERLVNEVEAAAGSDVDDAG